MLFVKGDSPCSMLLGTTLTSTGTK